MSKYIWMKVTTDKYELPVAVADSVTELAEMCGTSRNTIEAWVSHTRNKKAMGKSRNKVCPYRKVRLI